MSTLFCSILFEVSSLVSLDLSLFTPVRRSSNARMIVRQVYYSSQYFTDLLADYLTSNFNAMPDYFINLGVKAVARPGRLVLEFFFSHVNCYCISISTHCNPGPDHPSGAMKRARGRQTENRDEAGQVVRSPGGLPWSKLHAAAAMQR